MGLLQPTPPKFVVLLLSHFILGCKWTFLAHKLPTAVVGYHLHNGEISDMRMEKEAV